MVLAGTVELGDKVVVGLSDDKLDVRVERGAGPTIEEAGAEAERAPAGVGAGRDAKA